MPIFAPESTLISLYNKIYIESSDASSWSRDRARHFATLRDLCAQLAQYVDPLYAFALAIEDNNRSEQYGIIHLATMYPNLIRAHFSHYLCMSENLHSILFQILPILKLMPTLLADTGHQLANLCSGDYICESFGFIPLCARFKLDASPFIEPLKLAHDFYNTKLGISRTHIDINDIIAYLRSHMHVHECEPLITAVMRYGSIDDIERILRIVSIDNVSFKRGITKMISQLCYIARTQSEAVMLICNLMRDTQVPYGNRVMLQRKSVIALDMIKSRADQMGVPYGSIASVREMYVSLSDHPRSSSLIRDKSDRSAINLRATEKYIAQLRAKFIADTESTVDTAMVDASRYNARLAYLRSDCSYDDLRKAYYGQNPSSFALVNIARHIRGSIISLPIDAYSDPRIVVRKDDPSFETFARVFAPISVETCANIISSDTWRVWLCNELEDRSFIKRDRHQLYNALIQITVMM